MFQNVKFKNQKSVTFKVRSFAVSTKKPRLLKHTIYPKSNLGFTARPLCLQSGYGIERLKMTVTEGFQEYEEVILRQIDATQIKKIFCFSTHQSGEITNCVLAVTELGVYYVPLFGALTPRLIPNQGIKDFDCFAYSYTRDRDFVFAANLNGIFVADYTLVFEPLSASIRNAKQMKVFDKRLFVLDGDGETIHFTEPLDLLQFEGSIRIDQDFGKILSLDVYENKLLLVCENGFKVLEAAFDPSKFRIASLCRSFENVIEGSVRALGGTIFFLSNGGMCQSVRGKVSLLDIEIEKTDSVCSMVYDNKYYISNGEKMVIVERFIDSVTVYEGFQVRAFERVFNENSDRLAVLTDEPGFVSQIKGGGESQSRIWESEEFALTYASGNQFIRQILICTATDIDLDVISNRGQQRIRVKGSTETQKINLNFKGEVFNLKITAGGDINTQISALSAVVGF